MNFHQALVFVMLMASLGAQTPGTSSGIGDFYPNLQRALGLTPEQWMRVGEEGSSFQSFLAEKSQRLAEVDRELRTEQLRPSPDALALGARHVEIAAICRESTARQASLRQRLRGVLNAEQQARLSQLEAGVAMLPAISEGQVLQLLGTEVREASSAFGEPAPGWRATRGVDALLPGCPASPFGSFIFGGIAGDYNPADRFPNLRRYLSLTDGQIAAMLAANQAFGAFVGESQMEVAQLRGEMEAESRRAVPDAALLGAKAVRLEQLCRNSIARREQLREAVPKLLAEEQRLRWQELNRALQLLPVVAEAEEINLGGPRSSDALRPPYAGDAPQRGPLEWSVFFAGSGGSFPGCEPGATMGRWFSPTTGSGTP